MDLLYRGTRQDAKRNIGLLLVRYIHTYIFLSLVYSFLPLPLPPQPLHILHAYLKLWLFLQPTFITLCLCGITVFPAFFLFSLALLVYAHFFSDLHHG